MLFDAVFHADSEYHCYFAWKLSLGSQNREIRAQFFNFFATDFEKIDFLSEETKFEKKAICNFVRCQMAVRTTCEYREKLLI